MLCSFSLLINNLLTNKYCKKILAVTMLILLCIISGTRYELGGTDYYLYRFVYDGLPSLGEFLENFKNLDSFYQTFGWERGYLFFNSLCKTLGFSFYGFTLVESIIFYIFMYIGYKKYSDNFSLLIIVFLYKIFFYNTFISMRQSITLAIFFVAMHYIQEKKPIKYYICCLVALIFHNAALVLFLLYPISKVKLTKKLLIRLNIIFIPTIIIGQLKLPVFQAFGFLGKIFTNDAAISKAQTIISGTSTSGLNIFHILEFFLIMLLVLIYYNKIVAVDKNAEFILKVFLCLLPIMTLFSGYEILTRVKDYFTLTYGVILGYLCLISGKKHLATIQLGTVIICAFGFFRFISLFDNGTLMPYVTYLTKGISIFD